jgi:hypothetical protein
MNELTLQYPAKIAKDIGLSPNEINRFKRQRCRFVSDFLTSLSEPMLR